ncbi:hypothetical protein BDU57DRAFT_516213 [Ampelomyces quisqualis]|uniref:Uncharacterized protein n=1 Tax=Ampelomyces quisqualis TaxID=50730 RepID=A0A6A5QNE3_AMPQU|nr:hypothetical protein BDU57DRAFT_516213 [Ampelomyces quisqualis]
MPRSIGSLLHSAYLLLSQCIYRWILGRFSVKLLGCLVRRLQQGTGQDDSKCLQITILPSNNETKSSQKTQQALWLFSPRNTRTYGME